MTDQMSDRDARLAALAARRPRSSGAGATGDPWEGAGAAPAPSRPPSTLTPRRAPALASRVLVAGLAAASTLGLVAFIGGAAPASAGGDTGPPTTVIHRIVVVSSPPPPPPDIVYQLVPAGRTVTVATAPPPAAAPAATTTAKPKPKPAAQTQTAPPVTTTSGSGH